MAALAISSFCWVGNCFFFFFFFFPSPPAACGIREPARSRSSVLVLGAEVVPQAGCRDAQGVQSPCEGCPGAGAAPGPEPQGSGVWRVSFYSLWSRAGQGRQTALTATLHCGFPNMGVYFLCGFLFCFVLFVSFSSLLALRGQITTTGFFPMVLDGVTQAAPSQPPTVPELLCL